MLLRRTLRKTRQIWMPRRRRLQMMKRTRKPKQMPLKSSRRFQKLAERKKEEVKQLHLPKLISIADPRTQVSDYDVTTKKGRQRGKRAEKLSLPPPGSTAPLSDDATLAAADIDETDSPKTSQRGNNRRRTG